MNYSELEKKCHEIGALAVLAGLSQDENVIASELLYFVGQYWEAYCHQENLAVCIKTFLRLLGRPFQGPSGDKVYLVVSRGEIQALVLCSDNQKDRFSSLHVKTVIG